MPRSCTICTHPERAAIDGDLAAGLPAPKIAAKYRDTSEDALTRHRAHLPAALLEQASLLRRAALARATERLCAATAAAVGALERNLTCGNPAAEIRAATALLELAYKGAEVEDLDARLDALEASLGQEGGRYPA